MGVWAGETADGDDDWDFIDDIIVAVQFPVFDYRDRWTRVGPARRPRMKMAQQKIAAPFGDGCPAVNK